MRVPRLLLTEEDVKGGVNVLLGESEFVIDVETSSLDPRTNDIYWVGLGSAARSFLIPTHHPKGITLVREHREKTPAFTLYGPDNPLSYTPTTRHLPDKELWRPSFRMIEHTVAATYADPPDQLWIDEVCPLIEPLLFSERAKIGHNLKFDLMSLAKYYKGGTIPPGPYIDTMILQHVIDENLPNFGLKEISIAWFLGVSKKFDPKKWYPRLGADITAHGIDDAARYLNKDLRYCWYLKHRLWELLLRQGLKPVFDFEMDLYPVIMDMETTGIPIDVGPLDEVRAELEGQIATIEQRCYSISRGEFSLSNLEQKRWVMFGYWPKKLDKKTGKPVPPPSLVTQNLEPRSYTEKTKVPQLNKAALEYYADRNEVARLFMDWSAYEKLRGTFVVGLDDLLHHHADGLPTIHTNFKQHGTKTGRLSAEKPNPQQLPRGTKIRKLYVGGPGHVLIVADYDQIELRCLAKEANERTMIQIFKEGRDIHAEASAVMYEIDIDAVTDDLRQVGKTANFATGYGAGPLRVAAVAGITVKRAEQFLARYYETFSALEPWKTKVLREARRRGDPANSAVDPPYVLIPPFGRKRRLPELSNYFTGEEKRRYHAQRQAINARIQGFASYIMKMAMIQLHERFREYPAKMLVQVHDEIVVRTKARYASVILEVIEETMTDVQNLDGSPILGEIPLIVSAKAGYSWAAAKGK